MQVNRDFVVFFSLLSLSLHFRLPLANAAPIEHPTTANESDYEALLAIKGKISDGPHAVLTSWGNNSLHFCRWEGVTCGRRHRRVVSLNLTSSGLVGTLSPFVGNLSFLRVLELSNNIFHGDIPHQISHLSRLRVLSLGYNSFQGEIPSNLSRCLHLTILSLGHNQLVGRIPTELAMLPKLNQFILSQNNFSGNLQAIGIGNMSSSLQTLYLANNQLQGGIPNDFARLKGLEYLSLGYNLLYGAIPSSIFNLSSLHSLYLSSTKINGHLPRDLGIRLPQLRGLFLASCLLFGEVPTSLSNLTRLQYLEISSNSFIGKFSLNGNNLPDLDCLHLDNAFSHGGDTDTRDLSFLDSLTNCTKLQHLTFGGNSFTGSLPHSILNLSTTLVFLYLSSNQISGQLPLGLGKFLNLTHLYIRENHFMGPIPTDIGDLEKIELLEFSYNNFSGGIPSSLGNLPLLSELSLQYNNLEGSLPESLGKCNNLINLYLDSNKLNGGLPVELFHASSLIDLSIGQNNLQGSLPLEVGKLKSLVTLDVSHNRFSGEIPSTLGNCTSLSTLDMGSNFFVGSIPKSLSPLGSIQVLDLSCNNLSGEIPSSLSTWPNVSHLNLSFNNLEGEVPTNGVFSNTRILSVVGNNKLCGGVPALHLPSCPPRRKSKRRSLSLVTVIIIIAIGCVLIIVLLLAVCLCLLCSSRRRKDASMGLYNIKPFLKVSYQLLSRATNGFSPSNLIGVGGFGSVYKGILQQDGTNLVIAVKVLNLQHEGACKSFIAECKTLRYIRHRNLLRIITSCSSIDTQRNEFKALVYEFMPRGSLESWLHSNHVTGEQGFDNQSRWLSLFQRVSIAIDVGCALEYLHTECTTPIIHCDLKPTNILLDDDMIAHVGDFGLTKFLSTTSSMVNPTSSTQVRGTIGYAAPEYGLGSKVSPEGDIYSFGIVVLEMMTSKKPTDPMFNEGLNLHDFAKSALPDRVMEIIDQSMLGNSDNLSSRGEAHIREIECIKTMIMVGVQCSLELPRERMSIKNVVNELNSALQNLL